MKSFLLTTASVLAADLLTKLGATLWASSIVFNTSHSRLGVSSTIHIMIMTLIMVGCVCIVKYPKLKNIEIPAGLVCGGTLSTLLSMATGNPGVMDFIPIGFGHVANLADICLWIGILGVWYVIGRASFR